MALRLAREGATVVEQTDGDMAAEARAYRRMSELVLRVRGVR